jgi:hypothetical protein
MRLCHLTTVFQSLYDQRVASGGQKINMNTVEYHQNLIADLKMRIEDNGYAIGHLEEMKLNATQEDIRKLDFEIQEIRVDSWMTCCYIAQANTILHNLVNE